MHTVKIPIGDWSNDGHGKCEYFTIITNKSGSEIVDLHKKTCKFFDFNIGDICGAYEESCISDEIVGKLMKVNFPLSREDDRYFDDTDNSLMFSEHVFNLWMDLLQFVDNSFEWKHLECEDLTWRLSDVPGYGVFY